jgi:hypothetical protein
MAERERPRKDLARRRFNIRLLRIFAEGDFYRMRSEKDRFPRRRRFSSLLFAPNDAALPLYGEVNKMTAPFDSGRPERGSGCRTSTSLTASIL